MNNQESPVHHHQIRADASTCKVKIKCEDCTREAVVTAIIWGGKPAFYSKLCPTCRLAADAKAAADEKASIARKRLEHWEDICPSAYRDTDPSRLPPQQLKLIMAWKQCEHGVFCCGPSRMKKTRCCWMLIKRLVIEEGARVLAYSETEFCQLSARAHRERNVDEFLDRACSAKLLFLDDIGHAASYQQHLSELYHVVERRTNSKLPIIVTTQFTPEEMEGKTTNKATQKTVEAIVNRLVEFCEVVDFTGSECEK